MSSTSQKMLKYLNDLQVSVDYSWIIHAYLWITHGKFEKPSVCFSLLPQAVFPLQKERFFEIKNHQNRKVMKLKRRAPENDSDPFNQFFFDFRTQSKYEKNSSWWGNL